MNLQLTLEFWLEVAGAFPSWLQFYIIFSLITLFLHYIAFFKLIKTLFSPKLDYPNYLDIIQTFKCIQIFTLAKSPTNPNISIMTASIFFWYLLLLKSVVKIIFLIFKFKSISNWFIYRFHSWNLVVL